MARVAKYSRAAAGHLIAHYERRQVLNKKTGEMEYVRFGNRDIDTRWSPLNYRIWPPLAESDAELRAIYVSDELRAKFDVTGQDPEEKALARFRRILRETKHAKRRDLKCFCEWCMSLPDEIPVDRAGEFFDGCMRYCASKYGVENIIGGWVHFDEDHRPHLHVAFVPVTGAGDQRRVCAKDVLGRKHLAEWHGGLTSFLQKEMEINNPGVQNGRTKQQGGNRTVAQMKAADRVYDRTKGKEVDLWRYKALRRLQEALKAAGRDSLENIMVAASERSQASLKTPRKRTVEEVIKRR